MLRSVLANSVEVYLRIFTKKVDRADIWETIYRKTDKLTNDDMWIAPVNPNAGLPGARKKRRKLNVEDEPGELVLANGDVKFIGWIVNLCNGSP